MKIKPSPFLFAALALALLGCRAKVVYEHGAADTVGETSSAMLATNFWWPATALGTAGRGHPLTLTYGFVPDGTLVYGRRSCSVNLIAGRCPCRLSLVGGLCPEDPAVHGTNLITVYEDGSSDLFARMRDFLCTAHNAEPGAGPPPSPPSCCAAADSAAACAPVWQSRVRAGIESWAALSGVRVLEVPDDGKPVGWRYSSLTNRHSFAGAEAYPGECGGVPCTTSAPEGFLRADVRIAGLALSSNNVAWANFPDLGGDIVIDTTDVADLAVDPNDVTAIPTETHECTIDALDSSLTYHRLCSHGQYLLHDGRFGIGTHMALRNTQLERIRHLMTHEFGHSIGIIHPCPLSGKIHEPETAGCPDCVPSLAPNGPSQLVQQRIMEGRLGWTMDVNPADLNPMGLPFIPRSPQGPRADDVRAAHFLVGDSFEPNNLRETATRLGALAPNSTMRVGYHVGTGSIPPGPETGPSSASPTWALNHPTLLELPGYPRTSIASITNTVFDIDWYTLDLIGDSDEMTVSVTPVGGVYADNNADGSCPAPGVTTDTRKIGNLNLRIFDPDGNEVDACAGADPENGLGAREMMKITTDGRAGWRLRVQVDSTKDEIDNCAPPLSGGNWEGANRRLQPYVLEVTRGGEPVQTDGNTGAPATVGHQLFYACEGPGLCSTAGLALGGAHSCALLDDGTFRCWGNNSKGQLGDGTVTDRRVTPVVPELTGVVELAAGGAHTCARLRDGTVSCWGRNDSGQLGHDGTVTGVEHLAAGAHHTCARLGDGTVSCWGRNDSGQLGDGTYIDSSVPRRVVGLDGVKQIVAGAGHTCALRDDHMVWCWGANTLHQLGNGTNVTTPTPVHVSTISRIVELAAGATHTCALRDERDARVWCWGGNDQGQLGVGSTESPSIPRRIHHLEDVVQIRAGGAHTCALRGGAVLCWGDNAEGQLGIGTNVDRHEPAELAGLVGVVELALGEAHSCARLEVGAPRCWGRNDDGQLGDGSRTDRPVSVSVVW